MENYEQNIGQKVVKKTRKPFKSRLIFNTVKGVINHPILNIPAYTFVEDETYVECRRCILLIDYFANELLKQIHSSPSLIIVGHAGIGKADYCPNIPTLL